MNKEVVDYLSMPRHELVSLFGVEWQDPRRKVDDKLTAEERIALIPFIKPRITQIQSLQDAVISDLESRKTVGLKTYGTLLYPHNGRDMLQDLYEELLDAACYIKGVMVERDSNDRPLKVTQDDA